MAIVALPIPDRVKLVERDFANHKWRPGESFDRYLYRLLRKYDIELSDYYKYSE